MNIRIMIVLLYVFGLPLCCRSQFVEVVHDEGFMSTFLFEWLGAGYPKGAAQGYFDLVHPSYVTECMGRDQKSSRVWLMQNCSVDKEYSDSIKSRLKRRAETEAWNIADRQASIADAAFLVEERKISKYLLKCRNQIGLLRFNGANRLVENSYRQRLACIDEDLSLTRSSYQPTSKRKEQYLAIYKSAEDLSRSLDGVMALLKSLPRSGSRSGLHAVSQRRIVEECLSRWRDVMMVGREGYSLDD